MRRYERDRVVKPGSRLKECFAQPGGTKAMTHSAEE